jgi:RNA polymerase sigma factor (sigma-70 family)
MTAIEFNYQVTRMQSSLKNFALSLTMNGDDAKDLLQDTLLKALKYRDKFVDQTNLKAWLYTIMKNTFINNYRRKVKANTIIDGTKDLYYVNIPQNSGHVSPESSYNSSEIEKVVEELEDEYRIPFMMHFNGFKYKEIADELSLPIGTVKSRIFLARKKLMEVLKDFA